VFYVCLFYPHCFFLYSLNPSLHVALHSQGGDVVFSNPYDNTNVTGVEGLVKRKPPKLPAVWTDPLWTVPVA